MTITEFWNKLDELATSNDTSNALLEMADLLRETGDLPLLILCRRTPGRIHHLYTVFDERNPDATGNRYLICFTNPRICDRWDLTLECIRRYYKGEDSPLYKMLLRDRGFFELFIDFKRYVDFFFLQDCVSEDYDRVRFWIGDGGFGENPLPSSVPEYLLWIERQMEFLENRNARIATSLTQ